MPLNIVGTIRQHRWIRLSKPDQDIWDTLSEVTKVLILEKDVQTVPSNDPNLPSRSAQMAATCYIKDKIDVLNVATMVHKTVTFNAVPSAVDTNNGCTLLANAAHQRVPPNPSYPHLSQRKLIDTRTTPTQAAPTSWSMEQDTSLLPRLM